jgi:hypothetical protein
MEDNINATVKEITSSVIRFNTGIKSNDPEALKQFIPGFVDLLKRFKNLMLLPQNRTDEYCLKFKDDITAVFDDLFIDGAIFKKAENSIKQNPEINGLLFAIKHNGNPLTDNRIALTRRSGVGSFDEFVSVNEGLYSKNEASNKTIIPTPYITLIYNKFREWINEPLEAWTERFVYPSENSIKPKPLELASKAAEGSDRLVILGILASITTGNAFNFESFVSERFGIRGYEKAKSTHKNKQGFKDTVRECNAILKK